MSEIVGFDILGYYKKNSTTTGYYRLNRMLKKSYIVRMYDACKKYNMRFYTSDAHCKEYSCNGSCCGLKKTLNYSRGQFTEALIVAREKGKVRYADIKTSINKYYQFSWYKSSGFNCNSSRARAMRKNQSMADYIREKWNTPNDMRSPYKYFGGVLFPVGLDNNNDVIYEYRGDKID